MKHAKLPLPEVTPGPVPQNHIWGLYSGHETHAGITSLAIHVGLLGVLLVASANPEIRTLAKQHITTLIAPDLSPYLSPKKKALPVSGGGGSRSPVPPARGELPTFVSKQFTPPMVPERDKPKLDIVPTLEMAPDAHVPKVDVASLGDPFGTSGLASNGTGAGGGIGTNFAGGIGRGAGDQFGPGSGDGSKRVYRIGGDVSAPMLIYKVEPEYSPQARMAKLCGDVVVSLVVDEEGNPRDLRVIQSLGTGLDQKALQAIRLWRFKPGRRDGKPVAVEATVRVEFRLL